MNKKFTDDCYKYHYHDDVQLSFIVCTYNGSQRIGATLRSIIDACFENDQCEILVVDNASTDNTTEMVSQLLKDSPVVWRLLHEPVPGKANALALAMREARGKYFSVIDDDNIVCESWVSVAVSYLDMNPKVGLLGPKIVGMFPEGSPPSAYLSDYLWQAMLGVRDLGNELKINILPIGAGMTGRTYVMNWLYKSGCTYLSDRVGAKLTSGEDHEKGRFFKRLGWETVYNPQLMLYHVIPSRRLQQSYINDVFIGAAHAHYWLRKSGPESLNASSVLLGAIVDLLRAIRYVFAPPLCLTGSGIRRSSVFWRKYYFSRALGAYELLCRWKESSRILIAVSKAPYLVRAESSTFSNTDLLCL